MRSAVAYLDTEFDAPTDTLLSLALVLDDGAAFYVVVDDRARDPWVIRNVLPVLNAPAVGRHKAGVLLQHFMTGYDTLHIVADWPLDIMYFTRMLVTGPGEAMKSPRLTFEWDRALDSEASQVPHNALADAHAIADMDKALNR